ncbi:12794_t:CDS:10, partial [Acaulospora colombiana]
MVKSKKQQTTQLGMNEAKEAQENEIEALKGKFLFIFNYYVLNNILTAIFMEDYEPVVVTTAWKVSPTGHEFKLHLWPQEQELKNHVSVDLRIKLPKSYPRSAPDIKIENARGLSAAHLHQLHEHVSRLIKENMGQEMVYTIAQFVQEFITTNNNGVPSVGNNLTSFHDQMLNRIEQRTKVEKERAMEEKDRARQMEEQEREIESMMLMQKIEEETQRKLAKGEEERMKRKKLRVKDEQNLKASTGTPIAFPKVDFEKIIILDPNDSQMLFGLSAIERYDSLDDLLESVENEIPSAVQDVLRTMLDENHWKRPTPLELLMQPFFNEGSNFLDTPLKFITSPGAESDKTRVLQAFTKENNDLHGNLCENVPQFTFSPPTSTSQNATFSRYRLDFEEIDFLGKDSDSTWKETKSFSESISDENESLDGLTSNGVFSDDDDFGFLSASASKRMEYSRTPFENYSSTESDSEFEMHDDETNIASTNKNRGVVAKRSSSKEEKTRILYIQMEYCEKKTLKDIIDVGGTIHRDLKPSNIFLDANGDVKIGDFGLATTSDAFFDPGSFRMPNFDRMGSREDSMTGDVGTTLYVAPEVISGNALIGTRYNHKVDIYSLGWLQEILFDKVLTLCSNTSYAILRYYFLRNMLQVFDGNGAPSGNVSRLRFKQNKVPIQTHRQLYLQTIVGLRKPEIVFPKDFPIDKMSNQVHIIRWCLQHDSKNRPTSQELLKSEWLPAQVEDEYLQECIRTMANPSTPYYLTLLSNLFAQSSNKQKDYTYDFNSGSPFDQLTALIFGRVKDNLTKIFRRHGAVELSTPLLMPKSDIYEDKKVVYLMDTEGGIVQLPYDLTVPFSRYISRNNITDLKRYTFDQVYRLKNAVGGQPRFVNEADFDIVHSTCSPMVAEAEIFKIVDETILDFCRIPEECQTEVCILLEQLDKKYSMTQIRTHLSNEYELPRSILDDLVLFDIKGDLEFVTSALERMISMASIQEIFDDFQLLLKYAKSLGIHHEIIFAPLLTDVLAAGGRYDTLIQRFRKPTRVGCRQQTYAIGVNISVQKIVSTLRSYQSDLFKMKKVEERNFGFEAPPKCDVFVVSFGKVLLEERLDLVRELWAHNIKADFMYEESPELTPGMLASFCKKHGINLIVIMRHKSQDMYKSSSSRDALTTVKVKNLLKKTEDEVPRYELFARLNGEIAEQMSFEQSAYDVNTANLPIQTDSSTHPKKLSIYIVGPPAAVKNSKKLKYKQKQLLIDKASASITGIIENIRGGATPILALDISREILRKLVDCNVLEDEVFKSK